MVMDTISASIIFLLLLLLSSAEIQLPNIAPGSSLYPNSHPTQWLSPFCQFAFGFYQLGGGYIVGIWLVGEKNNTMVWTANRDDPPVTSDVVLQLTAEGKLVLQMGQGQERLIADASETASSASMLNSENFVLYNKSSSIIWQSFDHPTDTILGGQSLPRGGQLFSSSSETSRSTGQFRLKMQLDGHLVLYPTNTTDARRDAYWTSFTKADLKGHLYLNKTGILLIRNDSNMGVIDYLYDSSPSVSSKIYNENNTFYHATLDVDGVFRLYAHDGNDTVKKVAHWPGNACEVKGFCGFNSYCTFNDDQPYCNCLRGFDFIDPNQKTLGCKRNFSKVECKGEKDRAATAYYSMTTMTDIEWEDHLYFKAYMPEGEECSASCLADCNCWGALYRNGRCMKQGAPFRYVTRTIEGEFTSSATVFLKVGNSTLKNWNPSDEPQPTPIKSTSNKAIVHIIVVTSVFTLLLCLMIAISSHLIYKIRILRLQRLMETGNLGLNEEVALRRFSYNELKKATNRFKQELGKGAFGAVYKGTLYKDRRLIAVKRLEKVAEEGEREFQAEVRAIGKTHHRNLVRLLGFCVEGPKRLLVYEYMGNGSLGKLLFGVERRPEWDERVRIALDIARGILYLHEECEAPIIHCDIKPQNILMDEFWTAKISDFGLAKLLMPDQTRTFTGARGTRGYVAPEWHKNIPISVKADVYSYGILLLEILCCRKNIQVNDVSKPEEVLLSSWAYKCFVARDQLHQLVNWEVVDKNVLENMVKVALWCIQDEPALRPTMKSVVLMLEGIAEVATPPCPTSSSM